MTRPLLAKRISFFALLTTILFATACGAPAATPTQAATQAGPQAAPAQLYDSGLLQDDGTVLYSISFYSGPEALEDVTMRGPLPDGASLIERVFAPAGTANSSGAPADETAVYWTMTSVAANSIIGPFTYRVQFQAANMPMPAYLAARASWKRPQEGSVDASVAPGTLHALARTGTLTLDAKGTLDSAGNAVPVAVGETGIWLYAPAGALSEAVTLTFTREAVDDSTVPANSADTWWCAVVSITADKPVKLTQPILLGLPTRQVLTVGIPVQVLGRSSAAEAWAALPDVAGLRVAGGGDLAAVMLSAGVPAQLALGVKTDSRNQGTSDVPFGGGGGFGSNFSGGGFQGNFGGVGGNGFNSGFQGQGNFGGGGNGFNSGFQGQGNFGGGNFGGFNGFQSNFGGGG